MNSLEAYARLRRLGIPVIDTADAAAALHLSTSAATKALSRLTQAGLVASVRHGTWWVDGAIDPYRLPEYLTAPLQSYLSLHTALHLRGLIEQSPEVFYAASLARTQRITTHAGTFSIHHLAPEVFGGYEETPSGLKLATAERPCSIVLTFRRGARVYSRPCLSSNFLVGSAVKSSIVGRKDPIGAKPHHYQA